MPAQRCWSGSWPWLIAQILHVSVGTEPHVVCEVPAIVIGIFVDDDLIAVPIPVTDEAGVVLPHPKIDPPDPDPISSAAFQPEHVVPPEPAVEMTMFKGVIEMVVLIVAA